MNNISFTGITHVKYDSAFEERLRRKRARGSAVLSLNLGTNKRHKIYNGKWTTLDPNEAKSVSVLLINKKGGEFYHNATSKMVDIVNEIDRLKTATQEKLTAWIIGGQNTSATTKDINEISEVLCDREDIDTSIIAGIKTVAPKMTFHPTMDRFDLTVNKPIQGDLTNEFGKYFDIVELNNTKASES
jgi:hypothetical protein